MEMPAGLTVRGDDLPRTDWAPLPGQRLVSLGHQGWAAVAFLFAGQLPLVVLAASSVEAPALLITIWVLAQIPIVIGAVVTSTIYARWQHDRRIGWEPVTRLATRAERAEALLAREQDRMHELRATVSGIAMSQRLLQDRRVTLSRRTRTRLERLREAELARVAWLLADAPQRPAEPVALADVLDPLVDAVRLSGHVVHWTGTTCRALGRADDIGEIAHILLDNATRHAAGHEITLHVDEREGWVELRVRDSGPGVPAVLAQAVFERGTRAATSPGEGIGLHIARRLAHDLGGDLRLEPAESGAVFVLRLPPDTVGEVPCHAPAG
jgi:signal transduction histidine kinase